MKLMRFAGPVLALALMSGSAGAQDRISNSDVQRLQDNISDVSRDISQLRSRDGALASQLQRELDDARDEVTYLKVKARRNEPIATTEYAEIRDRIDNIRSRARGDATGGYTPPTGITDSPRDNDYPRPAPTAGRSQNPNEIPVGTEFDVRLQQSLSSGTSQPEDRFEATTMVDLRDESGRVLIPAGSVMRGIVSSVHKATRIERKGSMTVAFDRVTVNGRALPMRGTVTQALESEGIAGEKEKIGIGAGAGAILGAILGGAKGALAGILIGGGGTIAATEGQDVNLPSGTVLRVRLDSPLDIRR
ncbi:MAG TPA: hypothetical protein VFA59_25800 [Vicinamibacterales bacterium]|nr:hypothetical protein [Vicinamibacterales bacterium]